MGKPSTCVACKQRQLTSLAKLGDFSHSGYCPSCAEDLARRTVGALVFYDRVPRDLLDLLNGELTQETISRRLRQLEAIVYPRNKQIGLLVAVSRLYQPDGIEQHHQILDRSGRVVFGKFRYGHDAAGGTPIDLENGGRERYEGRAAELLRDRVCKRLEAAAGVHLFVLDPDPPATLWRGKIANICFAQAITPEAEPGFDLPAFGIEDLRSLIPQYYWLDPGRQHLRYHCNFWFLLDSLEQIDTGALGSMVDLETGSAITLATSQLYPAEVALPAASAAALPAESETPADGTGEARHTSIPFPSLTRALRRVKLTRHATRDVSRCRPDALNQLADLLVRMERYGARKTEMGVRHREVARGDGLTEFHITGGGRVAAAWSENAWHLVGVEPHHREGETFWNEMRQLWREELARQGKGRQR